MRMEINKRKQQCFTLTASIPAFFCGLKAVSIAMTTAIDKLFAHCTGGVVEEHYYVGSARASDRWQFAEIYDSITK